ncbi:DUF3426 domain-containing protein [Hydrogenophaga crassostreae]|nr:DUF3426 domain-containing protein [Hydrogenophaga crassostreae]
MAPPHSDPGWAFVERPGEDEVGDPVVPAAAVDDQSNGPGDDWDSEWLLSPNSVSRHREAVAKELQTQQGALGQTKSPAKPVDKDFERELDAFSSLAKQSTNVVQTPESDKIAKTESTESKERAVGWNGIETVEIEEDDLDDHLWPPSHPEEDAQDSGFDAHSDEPTFVVQARRDAFWRRPVMRVALLLLAGGLSALLALQWASFDRDQIAARYPAMEPMLKQLCAVTGCSLAAPRRIEAVVIDSSTLTRKLGQFYSFDLVVKNTEPMAVAMPALELSLTDARDKEIARRVFLPEEMPGTPTIVPANGSLSVSMRLSLVESELGNMAGYRALVFYP